MWPTEFMSLKRIEELLTCGICYEYMDTTMVTSCSHNYCSLCIRKYLHYKTQCPICSEETFEKDLRRNKILDEIIEQYLNIKEQFEKKSRTEETPTIKGVIPDTPSTPTTPCGQKDHQQDASTPSTSTEVTIPLMFTPKSRKGFRNEENCQIVTCPVCKVDVPQNNINKHLDDCLKRKNAKNQPQSVKSIRKPLPKLVLSLMKDNVIRKKLKELGLSTQGDRKTLENRLQKYTILYNAECDKANPRPVSELIKQCEEEENLEKKVQKPSNRLNVNRNTEHNVIEQQRKKYLADNKDSYNHLIMKIKRNKSRKLPVRRNILSNKNSDEAYKDCIAESSSISENDFLSLDAADLHNDDSDSNASCPLQKYSSEHPTNFLTIELSSSSNDSTDQYASNNTSYHSSKISPLSRNTVVKKEIMETDENALTHVKMASSCYSNEPNVSENRLNSDTKESIREFIRSESENREKTVLSPKRRKYDTSCSPEKRVIYSKFKVKLQKDLSDENLIMDQNSDNDDIQCDGLRYEQSNAKEKYKADSSKFEKENLDSLDENKKICIFRKQEREMTNVLSDEAKNENRSTSIRKSARLGLSKAKSFNNEIFSENTRNKEAKSRKKRQLRATHTKNLRSFVNTTVNCNRKKYEKTT